MNNYLKILFIFEIFIQVAYAAENTFSNNIYIAEIYDHFIAPNAHHINANIRQNPFGKLFCIISVTKDNHNQFYGFAYDIKEFETWVSPEHIWNIPHEGRGIYLTQDHAQELYNLLINKLNTINNNNYIY